LLEPGEAQKLADKFMKDKFGRNEEGKKYFIVSVYDVDAIKHFSDELMKILG
jgi:hypothetical protein